MPFLDHERGPVYYRHWSAARPRAAVIFLHGFGEHSGLYHRYGFALNAAGIDLWAVDQFGHGFSPGTRDSSAHWRTVPAWPTASPRWWSPVIPTFHLSRRGIRTVRW